MATFRHRLQRNIRDFVTLVTMIYDLFDDDPSFELVGVLRGTRRVCVTIQDCVMSTENLEREENVSVQWYKYRNDRTSYFNDTHRVQINFPSLKRSSAEGTGRQRVRCALHIF